MCASCVLANLRNDAFVLGKLPGITPHFLNVAFPITRPSTRNHYEKALRLAYPPVGPYLRLVEDFFFNDEETSLGERAMLRKRHVKEI